MSATFSTIYSGYAWARSKVSRLGALSVPSTIVDNDSTKFLKHCFVVLCLFRARTCLLLKPIDRWIIPLLVLPLLLRVLCQVGYVNGNPSGSRSEIRSKKLFVEELALTSGQPSGQNTIDVPVLHSTDHSDYILVTPRTRFSTLGAHEASR